MKAISNCHLVLHFLKIENEIMTQNSMFSAIHTITTTICLLKKHLFFVVPAVVLAILFFRLTIYASHGFDITDESYYLLWVRQPERILASLTQFGFYTKFLYVLSGENIAIFRILGVLILIIVAGNF